MNTKFIKIIGAFSLLFLLSSCDLGLQEQFNFVPEANTDNPLENMTAWEWIQSRANSAVGVPYLPMEYDYLKAAIIKADMVEEYNQVATKERTFLLLNNSAFIGNGNVINIITGSSVVTAGETAEQAMSRVDTPAELLKLKTVLKYHIVTQYILQVPTLYKQDTDYLFQTLIPGADGLIAFRRNTIYQITVNFSAAPLPSTATSLPRTCIRHNYQFKNGIGHILAAPVRNKPY